MALKRFDVPISDANLQIALQRAQQAGQTLDEVLTNFIVEYAGSSGEQPTLYTVKSGDTLGRIARTVYGDARRYPLIQQANNLGASGIIHVGQVLTIPPLSGSESQPDTLPTVQPTPQQPQPQAPQPDPQPKPAAPDTASLTLLNGDFETFQPVIRRRKPYFWRDKYPEEYGEHWKLKMISEVKDRRTHVLSSPTFGQVAKDLYGGSGLNYAYGGGNSQVIISQYGYDLVLFQTVAAQPGRKYRFSGLIVSFYKGSDNPATSDKIFKTLGIDPTGQDDYGQPTVVWGNRDSRDHAWIDPSIEVVAKSNKLTVFIRIENTEENVGQTELNIVHIDKFKLE